MPDVSERVTKILNSENLKKEKLSPPQPALRILIGVLVGFGIGMMSTIPLWAGCIMLLFALCILVICLWHWNTLCNYQQYVGIITRPMMVLPYVCCCGASGLVLAGCVLRMAIPDIPRTLEVPMILRGEVLEILDGVVPPEIEYKMAQTSTRTAVRRFVIAGTLESGVPGFPKHTAYVLVRIHDSARTGAEWNHQADRIGQLRIGDSVLIRGIGSMPARDYHTLRSDDLYTILPIETDMGGVLRVHNTQWMMKAYSDRVVRLNHESHKSRLWFHFLQNAVIAFQKHFFLYAYHIFAESVQHRMVKASDRAYAERIAVYSTVMIAMVTGHDDGVDQHTHTQFQQGGTLHLLAVSGFHIALLAMGLSVVTQRIQHRGMRYGIEAVIIVMFCLASGWSASAERACIMALLVLLVRYMDRVVNGINLLSATILWVVCISPHQLFQPGFQLSVVAVVSIVLIVEKITEALRPVGNKVVQFVVGMLFVTMASGTGTMMLSVWYFGTYPVLSIPLNLILLPLATLAMIFGASAMVLVLPCTMLGLSPYLLGGQYLADSALQMMSILLTVQEYLTASSWTTLFSREAWWAMSIGTLCFVYMCTGRSARTILARTVIALSWYAGCMVILIGFQKQNMHQQVSGTLKRSHLSAWIRPVKNGYVIGLRDIVIDSNRYSRWGIPLAQEIKYPRPYTDIALARWMQNVHNVLLAPYHKQWTILADGESALRTAYLLDSSSTRAVIVPIWQSKNIMQFRLRDMIQDQRRIPVLKQSVVIKAIHQKILDDSCRLETYHTQDSK